MIAREEYQARRRALAIQLPPNSVALIPAANELLRNGDASHRFRQDSDFYYLTGFNEPDALLCVSAGEEAFSVLFNRPNHAEEEQWSGRRLGQDDACRVLGVNAAYPLSSLPIKLPELLTNQQAIYYPLGRYPTWQKHVFDAWQTVKKGARRGMLAPQAFYDVAPLLGDMRLFKSPAEINNMRRAASFSVLAHQRAMRACQTARYEFQLEAELLYELIRQGCQNVAYTSIVAGGPQACVLHYTDNNQPLRAGDLVLIDAGGEYDNYAADITRTFPVNGRFTPEQRTVYEWVLCAQQAGIAAVRPGCSWDEIQRVIVNVLTTGLVDMGILHGSVADLVAAEAYKPFYMHQSGHWLGLDVHDSGCYKEGGQWRLLQPNMVLTVEPGLYISPNLVGVDERWQGIGVRIEDDVLVTKEGHDVLSHELISAADDIEAFMCE